MLQRIVAAASLAILAGCTLLVSTSGLSSEPGSPPEGGAGDGSPPGVVDAAEAGSDGGRDAEASDAGLDCTKPGTTLCDDFERGGVASPIWEDITTSTDGELLIANDPTRKSRVLRARLGGATSAGFALLARETGKTATSRIRYEFVMNALGAAAAGNVGQVNGIGITQGSTYWNVYVHVTTGGIFLAEQAFPPGGGGGFSQTPIPSVVQGSGWHSLVVEVLLGSPTRLRVSADGVEAFTKSSDVGIPSTGKVWAAAGISYSGENHPTAEVLVDDCVLTVE